MNHRTRRWVFCLLFCSVMIAVGGRKASADPSTMAVKDVPEPLEPWVDWVLYDSPRLGCPMVDSAQAERVCVWPGTLRVDADTAGADFQMSVWLARRDRVRVPGDDTRWPQRVRVDGRQAVVSQTKDYPSVQLGPGAHRISGTFAWPSLPEVLPAPPNAGRVSLRVGGEPVERPNLDNEGRLWMHQAAGTTAKAETDSIQASIYRHISDGAPVQITTELKLNVSGKARQIELGEVLLDASRPTGVDSPLPAQVSRDGAVSVYARPGAYRVRIEAVLPERVDALAVPDGLPDFYDPQEVWVWLPDEALRAVELTGLQTVDPAQTSLPDQWRGHTTFLAKPGQALQFDVARRGASPTPSAINLDRDIWLDVDGAGFTIQDHLTGSLDRDGRLDYAGPAKLGHVRDRSADDDMLITANPANDQSGVELRSAKLDLTADLRLSDADYSAALAAVGWNHDVQHLSATLHLPPGWTLLAAGGVDTTDGTWVSSWTLWDFFFVLMVALSIGKLLDWRWTPLAIAALVLSHAHSGAPMWVWLHLVGSLALLRALPGGWWRKAVYMYRAAAIIALAGLLVNFSYDHIQASLHPQVDRQAFRTQAGTTVTESDRATKFGSVGSSITRSASVEKRPSTDKKLAYQSASSTSYQRLDLQQVDPQAVVQTGPGLPNWSWNAWQLHWSGPVQKAHDMRLWLVSPMLNRILGLLRVALLIALGLLVLAPADMRWHKRDDRDARDDQTDRDDSDAPNQPSVGAILRGTLMVAVCAGGLLGGPAGGQDVYAQTILRPPATADSMPRTKTVGPMAESSDMLDTLRKRLVAARQCDGVCVVVSRADIEVDGLQFQMRAQVHAQQQSGWYLPGPADTLRLDSITIDGSSTTELRRESNGLTAVRIPAGRHTVTVAGRLANRNVVTVQFDDITRPKFVTFASPDWTIDGISRAGVPDNSLQLTRREGADTGPVAGLQQAPDLPAWYQVHRLVGLGLPWKVKTTVTRQDGRRPQLLNVPLLAGEKVITDGLRVEDDQVLVDFPRGESSVTYVSQLPIRDTLALEAPQNKAWTETWTVKCSPIWRCEFSDLPAVQWIDDAQTIRPTWKPWPGESLSIDITRPTGVAGQSSTIQSVDYCVTPGQRLLKGSLTLKITASQGHRQQLTLPKGAKLQATHIDTTKRSLRLDGRHLALPVRPGEHTYEIAWQQPWTRSIVEHVPAVDLGMPAANVAVRIERDQQRWLLRTMGPAWGPAILFWSRLVLLLVLAGLLSQLRGLPLTLPEWILLAAGMSQIPLAIIPVAAWFVVMKLRKARPLKTGWQFDIGQLAILGLTAAAAAALYAAIHTNLLFNVDMQVSGAQSTDGLLRWFVDRNGPDLPTPAIVSLPILVWRGLMLAWAFWLVSRLLKWVPWGWSAFSEAGLWRGRDELGGPAQDEAPTDDAAVDDEPADANPTDGTVSDGTVSDGTVSDDQPTADENIDESGHSADPPDSSSTDATPSEPESTT